MTSTEKIAPNYKRIEVECCRTCRYSRVDKHGDDFCVAFLDEASLDIEGFGEFVMITDWNGRCDSYEKDEESWRR